MSSRRFECKRSFEHGLRTGIVSYLRSIHAEYEIYRPGNVAQYWATRYTETDSPTGSALVQVGPIRLQESIFRDDGKWYMTSHMLSFSARQVDGTFEFNLESAEVSDYGHLIGLGRPPYLNNHPPTGHRFGKRKKGR